MRHLSVMLLAALCASCAITPHEIEQASAAQNQAVVFDIDGTLTKRNHAIRTTREGAADAVNAFAEAGLHIIYLSARTPLFQFHIPHWLERHGFPRGSIQVTQSRDDRRDHASFKQRILEAHQALGWTFVAAYGDSSTDFEAYAKVGMTADRVFALKREGEEACEPGSWSACYAGWPEQMDIITALIETRE